MKSTILDIEDGFTGEELFKGPVGLTYKDFLILPGFIDFNPSDVELESKITKNIILKKPFISSPMDTVTESSMAISLALQGGMGIVHYNNTIDEQVDHVRRVKRYENGFITDPIILSPEHTISDLDKIKEKHDFSGIPITEDGKFSSKLVGIVTNRDVDFEPNRNIKLGQVMTTELITGKQGISLKEANNILKIVKLESSPSSIPQDY